MFQPLFCGGLFKQSCPNLSEDSDSGNICPFQTSVRSKADVNRRREVSMAYALVTVDAGWCWPLIPLRAARAVTSLRESGANSAGEIADCSSLKKVAMRLAWPPLCLIVAYKHGEKNRHTETMGRFVTRTFRPTRPPGRSGPLDRTAGGIGGEAPASLDSYGQSRTDPFLHS